MNDLELKAQLEKSHKKSYAWALNCCANNLADAEDVLQTVYLKILEGRAKYRGKSAFKTWLFAVIRKTAADLRRRNQLRHLKLMKYEATDLQEKMDEIGEPSERMILFQQTLTELPKRQQQILELVFYHDLTLEESAEVMAVSIGSARTHYDRGKKRIRGLLQKSESFK